MASSGKLAQVPVSALAVLSLISCLRSSPWGFRAAGAAPPPYPAQGPGELRPLGPAAPPSLRGQRCFSTAASAPIPPLTPGGGAGGAALGCGAGPTLEGTEAPPHSPGRGQELGRGGLRLSRSSR